MHLGLAEHHAGPPTGQPTLADRVLVTNGTQELHRHRDGREPDRIVVAGTNCRHEDGVDERRHCAPVRDAERLSDFGSPRQTHTAVVEPHVLHHEAQQFRVVGGLALAIADPPIATMLWERLELI